VIGKDVFSGAGRAGGGDGHFLYLDFLRGCAAIAVVWLHWFVGHDRAAFGMATTAVDFFFLLSGFVIAHACDGRIQTPGGRADFLLRRAIRLWPVVLVGATLGLLRFAAKAAAEGGGLDELLGEYARTVLLIPHLAGEPFPLNIPYWSLLFEVAAYVVYCTVLTRRFGNLACLLLMLAGAAGVLGWAADSAGAAAPGREVSLLDGASRIAFAFPAGVLLARCLGGRVLRIDSPALAAVLAAGCLGLFALPLAAVGTSALFLTVVGVFPLLVALGRGLALEGRWAVAARWFGELSYPLYAVHMPTLWVAGFVLKKAWPDLGAGAGPLAFAACVAVALATLVWVDRPVRRLLGRKRAALLAERRAVRLRAAGARRAGPRLSGGRPPAGSPGLRRM